MHNYYEDHNIFEDLEDISGYDQLPSIKNMPQRNANGRKKPKKAGKAERAQAGILTELIAQDDSIKEVDFTYNATRHEREWIANSLTNLYEAQWFDDVLRQIKGGKEASVYQCRGNATTGENFIAAKIYRPRKFRNLKNDQMYREGRQRLDADGTEIIDDGMQHAMNKRTKYGLQLLHTSWIEHEYKTMQILSEAGAGVPMPFTRGDNAILMTYIGGEEMAAPTLNSIRLPKKEARRLFSQVLQNVELMLAHDRIHGDLSAYNILYWEGQITLIDFPQAISPLTNRNAFQIFERDVVRVSDYFKQQGVEVDSRRLAADMWSAHNYSLFPSDVNLRLLDPEDQDDFDYWEKYLR
jgi:RIO kinase 1